MSNLKQTVEEIKTPHAFCENFSPPAYQEIEYIEMNTEDFLEDMDENLRILNKVINKSEKKRSVVSRNTIRSSCACIDGFSYILKNTLKITLKITPYNPNHKLFNKKQLNYINNDFTNGSGAENFKESLKCFAKKYGIDVSNVFGTGEFDKLKKLFEIRNRLMHPKEKKDFQISEEETILLIDALRWFINTYTGIFLMTLEQFKTKKV